MSGAGRGTPRVSPVTGGIPVQPDSPSAPPGTIRELTNANFNWQNLITIGDQQLTDSFAKYGGVGFAGFQIPPGLLRLRITFKYTEADPAGACQFYIEWGSRPVLEPAIQSNPDVFTTVVDLRRVIYETESQVDNALIVVVPPSSQTMSVFVKESGVPATPGEFEISLLDGDNLTPIGFNSNISI